MMGRCVLKMDHYCVWMVNTIGLLNYKSFVLFLVWAFVACLISAGLLLRPCIEFVNDSRISGVALAIMSFVCFVFSAAFSLALAGFIVMHGHLLLHNKTTIEAYEKRPVRYDTFDARVTFYARCVGIDCWS